MPRLKQMRLVVFVAFPIVLAGAAGVAYAGWTQFASDDERHAGGVPISDGNLHAELTAESDYVGFAPLIPVDLPTEPDELVLVDTSVGPQDSSNGLQLVELVYRGEQLREVDGSEIHSTLEMFQTNLRLNNANGEQIAPNVEGYELYRDVVSSDSGGRPIKVTYTARNDQWTFVMDFTGDQPTQDGLEQMLSSLEPFKR